MASLRRRFSAFLCAALLVSSVPPQVYAAADRSVEPHGLHQLIVPLATSKPFAPTNIGTPGAVTGLKTGVIPSAVVPSAAASAGVTGVSVKPEAVTAASQSSTLSAEQSLGAAAESFTSETGIADGSRIGKTVSSAQGLFKARVAPENADAPGAAVPEPTGKPSASPLSPSTSQTPQATGELPAPSPEAPKDTGWYNGLVFMGSIWVAQIGVEAWAAVWNKWVQVTYGMDVYTMTTMVGMGTSLVAGYVGGWIADKVGLKKSLVWSWYGMAAIAAGTLFLAAQGPTVLIPTILVGTLVGRLFVSGAATTAEKTMPIAIFKNNKGALDKFNSISQTALEVVGIIVPGAVSTLLLYLGGPIGVLWLLPITLAIAASILLFFLKLNDKEVSVKHLTNGQPVAAKETDSALLSIGRWTYPILTILNTLLYSVIAIGYGNFIFPGTDPATAAAANAIAGKIVSLYSAGGLVAGLWLSGLFQRGWGWLKSKFPKLPGLPGGEEESDAAELRSTSKWIYWRAASMLFFIPMLFTSPMIVALAMIPFGFADVMAQLKILGVIQKNTPQESKGKIMGSVRTMVTLTGLVGFFGFSQLFKYFPSGASAITILGVTIPASIAPLLPFIVLLALNAAMAAYTIIMARRIKARIPEAPKN